MRDKLLWFGVPAVSNMMFEVGGLQFTAAPFTGWYQTTEIANRDLLDEQRYNLLEPIGRAMKLDMSSNGDSYQGRLQKFILSLIIRLSFKIKFSIHFLILAISSLLLAVNLLIKLSSF